MQEKSEGISRGDQVEKRPSTRCGFVVVGPRLPDDKFRLELVEGRAIEELLV